MRQDTIQIIKKISPGDAGGVTGPSCGQDPLGVGRDGPAAPLPGTLLSEFDPGQQGITAIRQVKAWAISPRSRTLPRTGSIKDDLCGEIRKVAVCSQDPKHDRRVVRHSCNRLECPICYKRTLQRNAEAVALRVEGYKQAVLGQRTLDGKKAKKPRPPRHGILSPPSSVINAVYDRTVKAMVKAGTQDSQEAQYIFLEKFRYEIYKTLDILGIDGAAVIIHLDRITKTGKEIYHEDQPGRSAWDWILDRPDWRDLVAFSPHVHIIFYGRAIETGDFYDKSGGWVFKNRGDALTPQGLAYYELSHAPVIHGRLSVTYWGCLSPRRLQAVEERTETEPVICRECGAPMVFADVDLDGQVLDLTDRPLLGRHRVKIYKVVDPPPGR